jgi:hypothetical protein
MRKLMSASLIATALLLIAAAPGDAREGRGGDRSRGGGGHGNWRGGGGGGHSHWRGGHARWRGHHHHGFRPHFFVGLGPWWGPGWYYPSYPYYVYSAPPVIVQQQPPVYVEQSSPPPPPAPQYWYYCTSAQAYYPTAPSCPEEWVKVPARSE